MADGFAPIIEFKHVTKSYSDDIAALSDVSFSVKKGEFVFIVGPSGSGKSTLIRLLLKEVDITDGTINVFGESLAKMKRRRVSKYRRKIGVVFQEFRLLGDRNVFENIAISQRIIGATKREMKKKVSYILSLTGLSDKAKADPIELSGGEKQRVALARALVNRPKVLLADEPTGNLDPKNAWAIMELLDDINKLGTTVIVVTHNPEIVDAMQKRVIVLDKGKIVKDENKGGYLYERY